MGEGLPLARSGLGVPSLEGGGGSRRKPLPVRCLRAEGGGRVDGRAGWVRGSEGVYPGRGFGALKGEGLQSLEDRAGFPAA
jgi:hypothetical protein